jgi:aldose 1-epimerase
VIGRNSLQRSVQQTGKLALLFVLCFGLTGPLLAGTTSRTKASIEKRAFGKLEDGTAIDIYTLKNRKGLQVEITTYGGTVVTLKTPDRRGRMADIVLGYADASGYVSDVSYFGALIGRYANRIARGRFTLNGVEYQLPQNNGVNHLHGGVRGFHKVVWQPLELTRSDGVALQLTYLSKDNEEGYPGNLVVTATYVLSDTNELRIEYSATTDKETVVNFTHHSYFNLAGAGTGNVLQHKLKINADRFTPVDQTLIPTGELRAVKGTPFDFGLETAIGSRINQPDEQLVFGKGYDHNFVLNKQGQELSLAATVYEPSSGRALEMWTTEPGVQLYSGNFLDKVRGKEGKLYNRNDGFCLEAQHFPDSPNHPEFPSTVLKPGERYTQTTVYKFMVRGAKEKP